MRNNEMIEVKKFLRIKKKIIEKVNNFFKALLFKEKRKSNIKKDFLEEQGFMQLNDENQEYFGNKKSFYENLTEYDFKSEEELENDGLNFYENIDGNDLLFYLDNIEDNIEENNEKKVINNKEEFLKLYSDIKAGKELYENISILDLLKVNVLLHEEIDLKSSQLREFEEIKEIESEISKIEKENFQMLEKIKKMGFVADEN